MVTAIEEGLIEGRIDQTARTVSVSRATPRTFAKKDWSVLQTKLSAWTEEVDAIADSLRREATEEGVSATA